MKIKVRKKLNTKYGVVCSFTAKVIYDKNDGEYIATVNLPGWNTKKGVTANRDKCFGNGRNIDESIEVLIKNMPFWHQGAC